MSSRAQRLRVPLGFVLAIVFILLARPRPFSLLCGLPVATFGLWLRARAAGFIRKNDVLATTGPYRFTRNPLYLGSTLLAAGFVIAANQWVLAALALLMLLGIYLPVIRQEEAYLAQRFGGDFHAYAAQTPRLLPRLWPPSRSVQPAASFSFALYRRHREYNALLGFVALTVVLLAKLVAPAWTALPW